MKALRRCVLFKKFVASSNCQLNGKNPGIRHYTIAAVPHRRWSFFSEDSEGESSVYQHALKFQKPSTINYRRELENSVSLIGTVERALKRIDTHDGSLGFHTLLNVKTSSHSSHYFKILLKMWHEMAELSINHVKPNDLIYVWGHLGTYSKMDTNGNPRMYYEVIVKELNYVVRNSEGPTNQEPKKVDLEGEDYLERHRNRLHLWQVFFANPYEWTDFRKRKKNPKFPDFKHKSTGESLWLNPRDPPWLKRQIELLDSEFLGQSPEVHINSTSCMSLLV